MSTLYRILTAVVFALPLAACASLTPDTAAVKGRPAALSIVALDSLLSPAEPLPEVDNLAPVSILGEPELTADHIAAFVRRHNPDFSTDIAEAFIEVGRLYGIRGDIALCQSILETGWFRFEGGTAVTPDQHNYCGLGVTKLGVKGAAFATVREGVTAQIQHLYAYACRHPLPEGETIVDPRFRLVERGIAPTWEGLNRRWAANDHYSERILSLYDSMRSFKP